MLAKGKKDELVDYIADRDELARRFQESTRLSEDRVKTIREREALLRELGRVCDRTRSLIGSLDKVSAKEVIESNRTINHAFQIATKRPENCVMKTCSCGRVIAPSEWFQLNLVGYQSTQSIGGELRNCSCQSTLLVITKR